MSGPSLPPGHVRLNVPVATIQAVVFALLGWLWHHAGELTAEQQRVREAYIEVKLKLEELERRMDHADKRAGEAP